MYCQVCDHHTYYLHGRTYHTFLKKIDSDHYILRLSRLCEMCTCDTPTTKKVELEV